jgi:hypothetical protein
VSPCLWGHSASMAPATLAAHPAPPPPLQLVANVVPLKPWQYTLGAPQYPEQEAGNSDRKWHGLAQATAYDVLRLRPLCAQVHVGTIICCLATCQDRWRRPFLPVSSSSRLSACSRQSLLQWRIAMKHMQIPDRIRQLSKEMTQHQRTSSES